MKDIPMQMHTANGAAFIEGYASIFGEPDLNGDIVEPGAFVKSLAKRGAASVKMLYQHAPDQPIGAWTEIREDAKGLFVRGRLPFSIRQAHDTWALIENKALDGLSIGFQAVKAHKPNHAPHRRIFEIDLWEVSIVTFPMAPGARLTGARLAKATSSVNGLSEALSDPAGIDDAGMFAHAIREAAHILRPSL